MSDENESPIPDDFRKREIKQSLRLPRYHGEGELWQNRQHVPPKSREQELQDPANSAEVSANMAN
jgi:hypothetical protein